MSATLDETLIDDLAIILEEENALLVASRAAEAAALVERKLAALQAFEASARQAAPGQVSPQALEKAAYVQRLAAENARFLEAIRNGVQSAISRLEGLNSSAYVGSYGRGGTQMAFTLATGAFNRKA
jgi:hypothetical protein